jgi:hypothetical protein
MSEETRRCSRCAREDRWDAEEAWIEEEDGSWTCPRCFTPGDRLMVDIHEEEAAADLMGEEEA